MNKWLSILVLLTFSLLGNLFHLDLFYSVAFIFGSISVLIAVRLHGILVGTVIAMISGVYTYILWGHPYAMLIFTIEALIVGLLLRRGIKSLIIADAIYWIVLGVPLVWLTYSQIMGMADDVALLILLKQPINAILNAIIATFLLLVIPDFWLQRAAKEDTPVIGISELVSSLLIATTFVSAITILLREGSSVVENLQKHTEYELRTTYSIIQPYLDEDTDVDKAVSALERVNRGDDNNTIKYIILGKDKEIISSNLADVQVSSFLQSGEKRQISDSLYQWLPERNGEPVLVWWKKAYYYLSSDITVGRTADLVLLKPSVQLISLLRNQQIHSLSLLLLIVVIGIVFSYFISNWLNKTIIALSFQTRNLSARLRNNETIEWPHSRIKELSDLSRQAEEMSGEMSVFIEKLVDEQEVLENRVKISNEIIDESFARSSAIVETAVEGIVTMDEYGKIESFNPAAENLFVRKLDDVIGMDFIDLLNKNNIQPNALLKQIMRMSDESNNRGVIELEAYTISGEILPVEIAVSVLSLKHKKIYTAFINDISERKQAEKLKNEFISNVSHELRTPLTSIRGAIGLMASSKIGEMPEKFKSMLTITLENTERLVRLINDILDIQKLEAGGVVFALSPIELAPIIEQCVEQNVAYAEQYGVRLNILNNIRNIVIKTEPDRLNQVLTNLISNAVKFSSVGDEVIISVSKISQYVRISVSDNGPGIPEEYRETIFDKFSQIDGSATRAKGGTGLGLNIAKSYVYRMNGEIGFDSIQGVGTTFFIELPVHSLVRHVTDTL
ncbi:MAG: ATP-binding protein [Gammaproteobacteria bacterium]|nr:ATP-binding protein [Gammaproteobacteria bacterium]